MATYTINDTEITLDFNRFTQSVTLSTTEVVLGTYDASTVITVGASILDQWIQNLVDWANGILEALFATPDVPPEEEPPTTDINTLIEQRLEQFIVIDSRLTVG